MTVDVDDFQALVDVVNRLLGPGGCPWDQEQTMRSLSHMIHEEVCELIDTLAESDPQTISDELGDVCIGLIFLTKAAEKEGKFHWTLPFQKAAAKLIRRHPHIFEKTDRILTTGDVEAQWEKIKASEPDLAHRKSLFDGISRSLPALSMTQKLIRKAHKNPRMRNYLLTVLAEPRQDFEEEFGRRCAELVLEAEARGIQAEIAMRKFFAVCRDEMVSQEKQGKSL